MNLENNCYISTFLPGNVLQESIEEEMIPIEQFEGTTAEFDPSYSYETWNSTILGFYCEI